MPRTAQPLRPHRQAGARGWGAPAAAARQPQAPARAARASHCRIPTDRRGKSHRRAGHRLKGGPEHSAAGRAAHGLPPATAAVRLAVLRTAGVCPPLSSRPACGPHPGRTPGAAEDNSAALLRYQPGARRPDPLPVPRGPSPAHLVAGLWSPGRRGVRRARRGCPGPGSALPPPASSARGGAAAGRGRRAAESDRNRRSW